MFHDRYAIRSNGYTNTGWTTRACPSPIRENGITLSREARSTTFWLNTESLLGICPECHGKCVLDVRHWRCIRVHDATIDTVETESLPNYPSRISCPWLHNASCPSNNLIGITFCRPPSK